MKTKAIVIKCNKCGATDILKKVGEGPSQTTDSEGKCWCCRKADRSAS